MKDAKGHGSDPRGGAAHQTAINKIGTPPAWFAKGQHISEAALVRMDKTNPDIGSILEPEEFGWDWRLTEVPLSAVFSDNVPFSDPERMKFLRSAANVPPVILALTTDNRARLLDGGHRLAVARERGLSTIPALICRRYIGPTPGLIGPG